MALNSRFRFENFVVGSANRLAVAAARAVAETPGAVYNPLFVYSGSGLGKTHLLMAIGAQAQALQPGLGVEYTPLTDFVEQYHAAISAGETDAFKRRYGRVDVLLLDDVQFLTGHRETQAELLRLFNALQGTGRQIVMASDRPPSEIADVDERLLTRLAGGLIVDIGAPDYETRVAILRSKCAERSVSFRPGVIEELARITFGSVRELQGALNRLVAQQSLEERPLDAERVRHILPERAHELEAAPPARASGEFLALVSDLTPVVAQQVEPWKVRIGEAIAHWSGEGYRTAVLERALLLPAPPDVEGLLSMYAAAVDHLRGLEAQVTQIDRALGAHEAFRDPERVHEAEELVARAAAGRMPPPGPSAAFTREGYEVGPSNQLAVRAADAVAQAPGQMYNPLFLYGPTGVGKTHLAHAIGNELVAMSGGTMAVAVVGAQEFVDELIAALQDGSLERWRSRYRAADALVLDDVHFVAGKDRTQEELFAVFNLLYGEGKQIVCTSDRPPAELADVEARLRSRFGGGLVVEIQEPDRTLRERLYARYLSPYDDGGDPALLGFLADRPASSVREIIGVVHRLVAAADVAGVPLSLELARRELVADGAAPAAAPAIAGAQVDAFFLDDEKIVWDWPDVGARVVEEVR